MKETGHVLEIDDFTKVVGSKLLVVFRISTLTGMMDDACMSLISDCPDQQNLRLIPKVLEKEHQFSNKANQLKGCEQSMSYDFDRVML